MSVADLDLMTSSEAADMLRLTERTLIRWRADHAGPPYLRIGGRVYYRRCRLLEWIEAGVVEPSDE